MLPSELVRGNLNVQPEFEKLMPFLDQKRPFESVSEFFGYKLGKDQRRRAKVVRKELESPDGEKVAVYFKLYGYRRWRRALSRLFKPTRSKAEFRNLQFFHKLGIPACEPVVQGEYKNAFGITRNCMIITKEVTGTVQLDDFIEDLENADEPQSLKDDLKRQISDSVSTNLRKIHDANFYHDDLKWRNILIRRVGEGGEKVEVFWIDCPNGRFGKPGSIIAKHGKIKDLATLDYQACQSCTKEERMYFLSQYSGMAVDDPALHALAHEVVEYRKYKKEE